MSTLDQAIATPSIEELEEMLGDLSERQEDRRITVLINFPKRYGPGRTVELTYGCDFDVSIGNAVDCPPTPYQDSWTVGMVVALNANGWRGRVKYVQPVGTHTGGQ
ncbi:hypothetical protein [Enteractinococcus helveticum]|uniref:Uncharacterized protein n=1 Tax=Enteractinococcus helveticum TaxID=1837282 RepID=A0A1B7M2M7_9MICC|nr:hypothetical protein [Enteractinococcus helveticum]OAV62815.1 hypothetical protein A6F49_04730 [Enteractinococcus helveticum]